MSYKSGTFWELEGIWNKKKTNYKTTQQSTAISNLQHKKKKKKKKKKIYIYIYIYISEKAFKKKQI